MFVRDDGSDLANPLQMGACEQAQHALRQGDSPPLVFSETFADIESCTVAP